MSKRLSEIVLIGVLGAIFCASASAETIYKWEDEYGQVHYSDVPRDGAQEVEIAQPQTFSSPAVNQSNRSSAPAETGEASTGPYRSITVVNPSMEENVWNTGGALEIAVSLQPGLQQGHRIRVYMDGRALRDLPEGSSSIQVDQVTRGQHEVYAEVRDEKEQMLMRAPTVTFYYKQTSVEDNRAKRPLPPIATAAGPVNRSDLPPVSRRKTVR